MVLINSRSRSAVRVVLRMAGSLLGIKPIVHYPFLYKILVFCLPWKVKSNSKWYTSEYTSSLTELMCLNIFVEMLNNENNLNYFGHKKVELL